MADPSDAFIAFYEADHPRVLRSVNLILGDPTRSARIAHEAFIRTHSAWRRVQGERAFHYAMRCAFRLAWRTRPADEAVLDAETVLDAANVLDVDPSERVTPLPPAHLPSDAPIDLRTEPSDLDSDLELALSALPRAQRSVIVFWYYLGLDEPAIAEVMSIRESQVALHLERARTRLMELLGEDRSGVA